MNVPFGDLSRRYQAVRESVDAAVAGTLRDGRFILGPRGARFEAAFAAWISAPHAIGVASGTDALQIALRACRVGPGDEVITVANTCTPTLTAIVQAGASPVLVDVDADTYTMDPRLLEARITRRTRAIVPVHLYGQPADMPAIMRIARARGVKVVEDCAQSHGARCEGALAGTFGDAAAFSFYPSKNLGAFGDAGMITTGNGEIADRCRLLRNYGQREEYVHIVKGLNSRLDEIQAAILHAQLDKVHAWNTRRRTIAATYTERLSNSPIITPVQAPERDHVFHLFVIQVPNRSRFTEHMKRAGVETRIHYPIPIHRQPAFVELSGQARHLPVTDALAARIVSLPMFPELTDEEVEYVSTIALAAANA